MHDFFEGREKVLNAFDSKIFPIKTKGSGYLGSKPSDFKILTTKQILERLPIALAQIKAGNNSESLLIRSSQLFTLCINQKKLPKKYITT